MTNREILEKAVGKALKNGWTFFDWIDAEDFNCAVIPDEDCSGGIVVQTNSDLADYDWHPNIIIFNHDFAKALWGADSPPFKPIPGHPNEFTSYGQEHFIGDGCLPKKAWQHHLQQMVIAEDPIKYLGEHL